MPPGPPFALVVTIWLRRCVEIGVAQGEDLCMTEVSDAPARRRSDVSHDIGFSQDLQPGKELYAAPGAQYSVDQTFGAASVRDGQIQIGPIARVEVEPVINNGCVAVSGPDAERIEQQLRAAGKDALNRPTQPGAEGPKDQLERDAADTITKNTKFSSGDYIQDQENRVDAIREALKGLNKEQTQRVLNAVNANLAGSGFRYGQTEDGAVWMGSLERHGNSNNGTYEPTTYMRMPECSLG